MKKSILLSFGLLLGTYAAQSQGCMAVRNLSGFGQYGKMEYNPANGKWYLNLNNRYFRSFRTFKGTQDQHTPKKEEVVNKVFTSDITVLRLFDNSWAVGINVPVTSNTRSSTFEHAGARHSTSSFGLGDIRLTIYKWLLNTATHQRGNIQVGLGIKLPTGDYKYHDYYYLNDSTKVLNPVDQSIQLGDGGTGLLLELNAFYSINRTISFYGNFFYMANPREQNGVSTAKYMPVTAMSKKIGTDVMGVPDQYTFRTGANLRTGNLSIEAGLRAECVPVNDLIGSSSGLRRPGYNISAELGIAYKMKNILVYAYLPVSIKRSISQSVTDKKFSEISGTYTVSAGGFADYLVFAGISFEL
jgi:hypothetical protein